MPETLTIKRHAALVDRMAETLGVDLEEATLKGQITPDTLCDVVLRCTGCTNPDGCDHWLDAHNDGAATGPDICRNGDIFQLLQAGNRV